MGCNSSKGTQQEHGRAPKLQPPAGRPAAPAQSLTRVKLVLLGATGVGKSCLVLRYVKGLFESASRVTVGAAFLAHSVSLPDGRTVKFEIWDTAGQERYASLAPLYYRGAGAAVVMYDITSAETFTKARYWVTELQKNAPGSLVIVLAGNKSDLAESRQVTREEGEAYAASNSMIFLETSAKTAANVAVVFDTIARMLAGRGAPPSGPPAIQTAPAAAPRADSKSQHGSSSRGNQQPQKNKPPAPPPATSAAAASTAQPVAGTLQGSTDSLTSHVSTASAASEGASEPLPPSSDAAVLDGPPSATEPPSSPPGNLRKGSPPSNLSRIPISASTQQQSQKASEPANPSPSGDKISPPEAPSGDTLPAGSGNSELAHVSEQKGVATALGEAADEAAGSPHAAATDAGTPNEVTSANNARSRAEALQGSAVTDADEQAAIGRTSADKSASAAAEERESGGVGESAKHSSETAAAGKPELKAQQATAEEAEPSGSEAPDSKG